MSDTAPGIVPGALPVERYALRQHVSAHAWMDLDHRTAALRFMNERLVLNAYRAGFGLLERPVREVREMVWDPRFSAEGTYREVGFGERPEVFDVLLQARAVRFDG